MSGLTARAKMLQRELIRVGAECLSVGSCAMSSVLCGVHQLSTPALPAQKKKMKLKV